MSTLYGEDLVKVYGPYLRADGRKHVILYYKDGKKVTRSYPKYLMEMHLNRLLKESETVDHIDNDYRNNDISNLQILDRVDNAIKGKRLQPSIEMGDFICPVCGEQFTRSMAQFRHKQGSLGRAGPFCSKQCAGHYGKSVQLSK